MSLTVRDIRINMPADGIVIVAKEYSSGTRHSGVESDVAVIAHPYGPLGGSQSDPVVIHLARHLASKEVKTFTFNFSGPTSFTGRKEREQYLTVAIHAINSAAEVKSLFCCGYSYGTLCLPAQSIIAERIGHEQMMKYILISPLLPPVDHLALWGEHDKLTSAKRLSKAWQDHGVMVTNADHFWRRTEHLSMLTHHIDRFIDATP